MSKHQVQVWNQAAMRWANYKPPAPPRPMLGPVGRYPGGYVLTDIQCLLCFYASCRCMDHHAHAASGMRHRRIDNDDASDDNRVTVALGQHGDYDLYFTVSLTPYTRAVRVGWDSCQVDSLDLARFGKYWPAPVVAALEAGIEMARKLKWITGHA